MKRDDLAGLNDAQLATLGNVGLLKRARREVEAGRGPTIVLEADGALVGTSGDGAVSRIGRDIQSALGSCTCGAPRACRHRLATILAYQAEQGQGEGGTWDPGSAFDDVAVEALLGKRLMNAARSEAASAIAIRTLCGQTPAAELPTATVSFWVRDQLHLARCDCGRAPCEHIALAVWAFRRAPHGGLVVLGQAVSEEASATFARIEKAIDVMLEDGFAALADVRLIAEARAAADHDGMVWLADALEDVERAKEHYDRQSTVFRIEQVVACIAELLARMRAATTPSPALPRGYVLGADVAQKAGRIDRLRLIGIGAQVESDGSRRIARAFFVEPISSTVLALHKEWDFGDANKAPVGDAVGELFASSRRSLVDLCGGYTVARGARRRDNGLLDLSRARSLRPSNPSGAMWGEIGTPILIESLAAHGAELDHAAPAILGPRLVGRGVHVVRFAQLNAIGYSAARQEMAAIVEDAEGTPCVIRSHYRDVCPGRVDALYRALSGGAQLVAGRLSRTQWGWKLRPLALVDRSDNVCVPDIARERPTDKDEAPSLFAAPATSTLFADLQHLVERGVHRGRRNVKRAPLTKRFETAGLTRMAALIRRSGDSAEAFGDLVIASPPGA